MRVFYSPGRVNLIGEYTDFNGGYVFPCAIDRGIYAACARNDDNIVRFRTTNFDFGLDIDLRDELSFDKEHNWVNYPKGVMSELVRTGMKLGGLDILVSGDIPVGAGLSSSASIEVLTAVIFNDVFNLDIDCLDIVKLTQRAENYFVGVMCGIMDQFAVTMGREHHAIMLNCSTLEYSYAPLRLRDTKLIIGNTNLKRGLLHSKYNERRAECEAALSDLQTALYIKNLCEIDSETFDKYAHLIKDSASMMRARHIVYENERTKAAYNALSHNDLIRFGKLLNESHHSLKNDLCVSCSELDALAETAQRLDGCYGSRMTGAGFGGCTVSIVESGYADGFIKKLGEEYTKLTGLTADFYVVKPSGGAGEICE